MDLAQTLAEEIRSELLKIRRKGITEARRINQAAAQNGSGYFVSERMSQDFERAENAIFAILKKHNI